MLHIAPLARPQQPRSMLLSAVTAVALGAASLTYAFLTPTVATAEEETPVCTDAWTSTQVYTEGDTVSHDSATYTAQWWTRGDQPGTTSKNKKKVWEKVGECTESTLPPELCDTVWSADATYTKGDVVSYGSSTYRALWWTRGQKPDTAGKHSAWEELGACVPAAEAPEDRVSAAYFTEWSVSTGEDARGYSVKQLAESGAAEKLTHIIYSFGDVVDGQCKIADPELAYQSAVPAERSVDGVGDDASDESALKGNFNQLLKLKDMYPDLKIVYSFGGWSLSGGFGEAAQNPERFTNSCYDLLHDERWDGLFDGIDIDWEYPNGCGATCDTSGPDAYPALMKSLDARFDLVVSAIPAAASKLEDGGYKNAIEYVDLFTVMNYDYFGGWDPVTAPHSPLYGSENFLVPEFNTHSTIQNLKANGFPADKLVLGLGFYARGWGNVEAPKIGLPGEGAAAKDGGVLTYRDVVEHCPATYRAVGTAYGYCNGEFWGYDTPDTIQGKMKYANHQGLRGGFAWELAHDTDDAELLTAMYSGLHQ